MRKNDVILVIIVLCAACAFYIANMLSADEEAAFITITVDGQQYGSYELTENQVIEINKTNILKVKNGIAEMTEATCKDKLCVHQKAISRDRESIICLPNKVIVEVTGKDKAQTDAVAN